MGFCIFFWFIQKSGLKYDQFSEGWPGFTCTCAGCTGPCTCCTGGETGCSEGAGGTAGTTGGGHTGGSCSAGGPPSAMAAYICSLNLVPVTLTAICLEKIFFSFVDLSS